MRYVESCHLPTQWGEFQLHAFEDASNDKSHLAITMGAMAIIYDVVKPETPPEHGP